LAQISSRFPRFSFCLLNCPPTFLMTHIPRILTGFSGTCGWGLTAQPSGHESSPNQYYDHGPAALPAYFCDLQDAGRRLHVHLLMLLSISIYLSLPLQSTCILHRSLPVFCEAQYGVGPTERPTEPHQPARYFPELQLFRLIAITQGIYIYIYH
jgi:hypothetical protein